VNPRGTDSELPRGAPGLAPGAPETAAAPPRVLLVDDDEQITRSLELALRKERMTITRVASGAEALERMAREAFDVVVSDERMPAMSGSELLAVVRERHPAVMRIILSGQASLEAAVAAINGAEIHRFLLKPCPAAELAVTIRDLLRARDERRGLDDWRARQRSLHRGELEQRFERALARSWTEFQPILRAGDGALFGYEALARCGEPGFARPVELFAAAGELERSIELGRHLRADVARRIHEAPPQAVFLVNVDPEQLADAALLEGREPLAAHAARVVIEITERESLHQTEDLGRRVAALRARGYRIAVDDLGAGYAGLNSLVLLEPDVVKFDMELVRSIERSPTKQKLVASMAKLCREMGIATLAEGVETEAERTCAVDQGCELLQGFLFAPAAREFWAPRRAAA
jgi:EAL domain-containing protein (putative c-di-GMP-specific phosphodiesterase class I)/AmiR/NasT family two-component response regulator